MKNKILRVVSIILVSFMIVGCSSEPNVSKEVKDLRKELKEKHDMSNPSRFAKNDLTRDWRYCTVISAVDPSEYAVDYAKAYMIPDDAENKVHFIVNFTLKTTTKLVIISGILETTTTEYVNGEELDASEIGHGYKLASRSFNLKTGEEYTADSDPSAGPVSPEELIAAVREVTADSVGEGEAITDISFADGVLSLTIDLSGADTSMFTPEMIAEVQIGSITDNILTLDDSYYNTWESIHLDFIDIGSIDLYKSQVKASAGGRYFEY